MYLRQATRGLWGKKRLEVREELATHLEERITAHRIGGLSEAEATERALAELGAPMHVSQGMTRLYTLPTVMGSSLALLALCLVVLALWPKSMAQTLTGTFYWPSRPCVNALGGPRETSTCFTMSKGFWVSHEALRQALEPQGVEFSRIRGPAAELLRVSLPDTTAVYIPLTSTEGYEDTVFVDDTAYTKSADYLSFWELVAKLSLNDDVALRISGWDEPTVQFNGVNIDLGEGNRRISGDAFYESYLDAIFDDAMATNLWDTYRGIYTLNLLDLTAFASPRGQMPEVSRMQLTLDNLQTGVYGMITFIEMPEAFSGDFETDEADNRRSGAAFFFQAVQPTESGTLPIRLPGNSDTQPNFVTTFGFGEQLTPGDSVLFRLAGGNPQTGGWYEIVSPESVRLEPR